MKVDLAAALDVAIAAAREAGELIRAEFHREGGPRHRGLHHADVDTEAEAVIRARLTREFPGFSYVGEETGAVRGDPGAPTWFVDPHDGTRAFIEGWRGSAVSIALVLDGLPVLGVVYAPCAPTCAGDLISWAEGQPVRRNGEVVDRPSLPRQLGPTTLVLLNHQADRAAEANAATCAPARFRAVPSIAYRCALVAAGEGDVAVSLGGPVAWDFAAGHALLRGAGGDLVDQDGRPIRYASSGTGALRVFGGSLEVAQALALRNWNGSPGESRRGKRSKRVPPLRPSQDARVANPGLLDRAQGVLLGQVVGDALGQLVEFRSRADIEAEFGGRVADLVDGGTWDTIAGQPTDDSELALALARSLVEYGKYDEAAVKEAYVAWLESRPFDVGTTTRAGLRGTPNHQSQANGALMRVSPLAVFAHALPSEVVGALARQDAALTHPNPVCRDASAAYCVAVAHAVRTGDGAFDAWKAAVDWCQSQQAAPGVLQALLDAATSQPPDFERQQGWVLVALQNAFFQAIHAENVEDGLVSTVGQGGDTDTNGAIAGALLGALHGASGFPQRWTSRVLSCRPIGTRRARPAEYWPVDVLVLAEALLAGGIRHHAQGAPAGNVVPLFAKKAWDAAYSKSVHEAAELLKSSAGTLFGAGVNLAIRKAWKEWEAAQPVGMVCEFSSADLMATEDPCVQAVAKAVQALEQAWDTLQAAAHLHGAVQAEDESS